MAYFRDSDEVFRYVGQMFELFIRLPEAETKLEQSGVVVRLTCAAPDCVIVVDFPNRKVFYHSGSNSGSNSGTDRTTEPNVDLSMTSDDAHRFWMGRLNFPVALAQRKVRVRGSTAKAMKLLPLTGPLFVTYRALLERSGRRDLISAA